jgi:hypothetical protein
MKNKLLFIFVLIFILNLNIVLSQPITQVRFTDAGVIIIHPETFYSKINEDLEINFWTYNKTSGATFTNLTLNCTYYLIDNQGVNIFRASNQIGANTIIKYGKGAPLCVDCWTFIINGGNFTEETIYSYQIKCQGQGIGGYNEGFFEITDTGRHKDQNIFMVLIYIILFFIFFGYFFYATNVIVYFLNLKWIDGKPNDIFYIKDFLINWGGYFFLWFFFYIYNYYYAHFLINQVLSYMLYISVFTNLLLSVIAIMISIIYFGLNNILNSVGAGRLKR